MIWFSFNGNARSNAWGEPCKTENVSKHQQQNKLTLWLSCRYVLWMYIYSKATYVLHELLHTVIFFCWRKGLPLWVTALDLQHVTRSGRICYGISTLAQQWCPNLFKFLHIFGPWEWLGWLSTWPRSMYSLIPPTSTTHINNVKQVWRLKDRYNVCFF